MLFISRLPDLEPEIRRTRGEDMGTQWLFGILVGVLLLLGGTLADAAKWTRQYIRSLPDSAFAVIEPTGDGKTLRRLPHHDANGKLDIPHLCNALSRVDQVRWRDPANAEIARQHLREHLKEPGRDSCRPSK